MRNIFIYTAIIIILSFYSCSTEPTNEKIAEQAVVENLLDPTSWKLISSEMGDTFTLSDNVLSKYDKCLDIAQENTEKAQRLLDLGHAMSYSANKMKYYQEAQVYAETAQEFVSKAEAYKLEADSIKNTPTDTILYVVYNIRGSANGRLGNRIINDFEVHIKDGSVIHINTNN